MLNPKEIVETYSEVGKNKANNTILKTIILAILGGMCIAFAGIAAQIGSTCISNSSVAKIISGFIFPAGLIMIIIMGAELFTGDCLAIISLIDRKINVIKLIKLLFFVYVGNFIGSLIITKLFISSFSLGFGNYSLLKTIVNAANSKCAISFAKGINLGILCNMLVCGGVILALASKDLPGKVLGAFVPVSCFVIGGFEHCIANMYYIPAGLMAIGNSEYVKFLSDNAIAIENITIKNMLITNLIPVTIGNILGGFLLAIILWVGHKYQK